MSKNYYKNKLGKVGEKVMGDVEPIVKQAVDEIAVITKDFIDAVLDELFHKKTKKRIKRK